MVLLVKQMLQIAEQGIGRGRTRNNADIICVVSVSPRLSAFPLFAHHVIDHYRIARMACDQVVAEVIGAGCWMLSIRVFPFIRGYIPLP